MSEFHVYKYQETLAALSKNDLGQAFILARNGLLQAEKEHDSFGLCSHQSLFARIHLLDDDRDSARRALKLMKLHMEKLTGEQALWASKEFQKLSEQIQ